MRWAWRTVDRRWAITIVVRSARHAGERALDGGLGLVVDRGGGLVEHEDGGVAQDGAGDGEALALAAGELLAALADDRVVAVGQGADEGVGLGEGGGPHHVGVGGVGPAVGEVLADRALEQEHVLAHEADRAAQRAEGELARSARRRC